MYKIDEAVFLEEFKALLNIDSTTGQFREITAYVVEHLKELGYDSRQLNAGGILTEMGGEGDPLLVCAHLDDIGGMVRHIYPDGTLKICKVGGLNYYHAERENVRVHTAEGKVYTGVIQRLHSSVHVQTEFTNQLSPEFDAGGVRVILDEDVKSDKDVRALGIEVGDYIALDPRLVVSNGYLKSRFVDDKAMAAILLCALRTIKEQGLTPARKVTAMFTLYEEIGHGLVNVPEGTTEVLAMDIAPTGPEQTSNEHKTTIFCKDSRFPYHQDVIDGLVAAARREGVPYVKDIFTPSYGTDADTALTAGCDVRHGSIGPGTLASHGYERTHMDGVDATYRLLMSYIMG